MRWSTEAVSRRTCRGDGRVRGSWRVRVLPPEGLRVRLWPVRLPERVLRVLLPFRVLPELVLRAPLREREDDFAEGARLPPDRRREPPVASVCSMSLLVVRPAKTPPQIRWEPHVSLKLLTGHVLI